MVDEKAEVAACASGEPFSSLPSSGTPNVSQEEATVLCNLSNQTNQIERPDGQIWACRSIRNHQADRRKQQNQQRQQQQKQQKQQLRRGRQHQQISQQSTCSSADGKGKNLAYVGESSASTDRQLPPTRDKSNGRRAEENRSEINLSSQIETTSELGAFLCKQVDSNTGELRTGSCAINQKRTCSAIVDGPRSVAQRACSEATTQEDECHTVEYTNRKIRTKKTPSQATSGDVCLDSSSGRLESNCISARRDICPSNDFNREQIECNYRDPQQLSSSTLSSFSSSSASSLPSESTQTSSVSASSEEERVVLDPVSSKIVSSRDEAALSHDSKLLESDQRASNDNTQTIPNRKQLAIKLTRQTLSSKIERSDEGESSSLSPLDNFKSVLKQTRLVRAITGAKSSLGLRSFIADLQLRFNTDTCGVLAGESASNPTQEAGISDKKYHRANEITGDSCRRGEHSTIIENIETKTETSIKMISNRKVQGYKQQQEYQLEDRRSTLASSTGVPEYNSSFSSGNNNSEGNLGNPLDSTGPSETLDANRPNANMLHPRSTSQVAIGSSSLTSSNRHATELVIRADEEKRENWGRHVEFLLAVIGFAVDLGNVWRFPYICYKNGGGAFLIPYTFMFILGGVPIFYLEISAGQYFSRGCLSVWRSVCPMFKGIGYAMCILNFYTGLYYNTIISWAVYFFVESFSTNLPWTSCDNLWNRPDCRTIVQRQALLANVTNDSVPNNLTKIVYSRPTTDYFERHVLQVTQSTGVDDLGGIRTPLAVYLAIVFVCIYFAIWKGVKSTGKAVWITALLPYVVLIPLLIRGVFLEGAKIGIEYYLYPDWSKILDAVVWVEAAKQIFFSLGPGFGTLMALSSYNKFDHNCCRDAIIASVVNYFASFIAGLVIFAVLGHMATLENVSVSEVATEGPGLVFQVYPEGLATMRFSSLWSIFFFMMVISLGIDSTFGGLESVITGLCDEYPRSLRAHRGIFIGVLIIVIYFCSLPTTTHGGKYVIFLLESYGTSLSLLFIVLVETIVICWIYGVDKFCRNLQEMTGAQPAIYWRICWKYISPMILIVIFFAACAQEFDTYHTLRDGDYTYPAWAPLCGLIMTGSSISLIPIYAIYFFYTKSVGRSWKERFLYSISPVVNEKRRDGEALIDSQSNRVREENEADRDTVI